MLSRIGAHLRRSVGQADAPQYFQIRLMLVSRDGRQVVREEVYRSAVHPLSDASAA